VSITNAQLRWVSSLAKKSARVESGRFFAEGLQSLRVLAQNQYWLDKVYLTEDFERQNATLVANLRSELVETVEPVQIARMADATTPQGVLAICKLPTKEASITGKTVVYLEQISDPGNLGTIIRTIDATGSGTLLIGEGSVDAFSPKVVRSSAGSVFNVPIIQHINTEEVLSELRSLGYKTYAADMTGTVFSKVKCEDKHAWVFGNEAHGLSRLAKDVVDESVSIPIFGQAESLNLSVAAGVLLYHSALSQQG
jgi:TrmH family RNA methyltransferase